MQGDVLLKASKTYATRYEFALMQENNERYTFNASCKNKESENHKYCNTNKVSCNVNFQFNVTQALLKCVEGLVIK